MANVKFSELALNSATSVAVRTQVANGVKVYRALLSQSGTSAPVATVLENTLGGTLVWTYEDVGNYEATLAGVFVENKILMTIASDFSTPCFVNLYRTDADSIYAQALTSPSGDTGDNLLFNTVIEILIYP